MGQQRLRGLPGGKPPIAGGVPLNQPKQPEQQRVPPMQEIYPYLRISWQRDGTTGQPVMLLHCESPRKVMVVPMSGEYALGLAAEAREVARPPVETNGTMPDD